MSSSYANTFHKGGDLQIKLINMSALKVHPPTESVTHRSDAKNIHKKSNSVSFGVTDYFGKIGWGSNNPNLAAPSQRVVLKDQPHKSYFEHEKFSHFLKVNGNFHAKVD